MTGSVTVIKGTMGAGKTHALDAIYEKNSTNCLRITCTPDITLLDILIMMEDNPGKDIILIDEFQFCAESLDENEWILEQFKPWFNFVGRWGKDVYIAGLVYNWENKPYNILHLFDIAIKMFLSCFPNVQKHMIEKYSVCENCGRPAIYNNRRIEIKNEAPILLDKSAYIPLCETCSKNRGKSE